MRTEALLAVLAVLVLLTATASFTAPSSIGPTGILNVPTTETVTPGSFEMLLAYDRPKVGGVAIDVFPVATLGYGFANGEVGVSYFNAPGYTAVKGANAKYIFAHENEKSPSIGAGLIYLNGNTAETDVYLVAGHSLSLGSGDKARATAGLLYQRPNHGSNLTEMVGIEFGTPEETTLGFDYIFKDIAAGSMFGVTARHHVTRDLAWQVGLGNHDRFLIGLTMKFGGR